MYHNVVATRCSHCTVADFAVDKYCVCIVVVLAVANCYCVVAVSCYFVAIAAVARFCCYTVVLVDPPWLLAPSNEVAGR